jgi:hypothetical protein
VEAIIVGTVADMGNSVDLRARLVDVEQGAAITAAQVDVTKDPTITGLLGSSVRSTAYGKRSVASQKDLTAVQETNVGGFNFKLIDWQRKGEGIVFELLVTSEEDSVLQLFGVHGDSKTRVFDDFGNEYFASKVQLGNSTSTGLVNNNLVAGVPMKLFISFDKFATQANTIPVFEISIYRHKVQLRDISLVQ